MQEIEIDVSTKKKSISYNDMKNLQRIESKVETLSNR